MGGIRDIENWIRCKERYLMEIAATRTEKTLRDYKTKMRAIEDYFMNRKHHLPDPARVTKTDVLEFLMYLNDRNRFHPNYANKIYLMFINFLIFSGNKKAWEWKKYAPKRVRTVKYYLSEEDLKSVLNMFEKRPFKEIMFRTLVHIYVYTGMRYMEALSLTWRDIDFNHDVIIVRRGKGGHSRQVLMHPDLKKALEDYRKAFRDYMNYRRKLNLNTTTNLFFHIDRKERIREINRLEDRYFYMVIKRRAESIGIRINIKIFRSTFVKIMHDLGAPTELLTVQLGHKDIRTTMEHYHQAEVVHLKNYFKRLKIKEEDHEN